MNVASLELCKELHEISGWNDDEWRIVPDKTSRIGVKRIPAYTLGYLFAQLIVASSFTVRYVSPVNPLATDLRKWYGKCIAYTPEMKQRDYPMDGSPEDALCKLAIELFKQGILTKDSAGLGV